MDTIDPMRFVLAFVFVIGLIGLMAACLRYWGKNGISFKPGKIGRASDDNSRIKIIETRYLDARRRVVLLRRDDKEHLLLLADGREQLLESYPAKEGA